MGYDEKAGREDLRAFEDDQPPNYWYADAHARRVLAHLSGGTIGAQLEEALATFGEACGGAVNAAVNLNNRGQNLPVLDRYGNFGDRCEAVLHHPSYHEAGRAIYGSGAMQALGEPGGNLASLALFYLSSQNGEAGHNCPLACTAGVIKALLALGDEALRERFAGRLLATDYDLLAHGAQFLTEVQGGSDVGANALIAKPDDNADTWSLWGEKWFCSNVTADLMLLTARPQGAEDGTKGLGLFLAPRRLPDGRLNAFKIRRLKDKLGTRTMASAEVDFEGLTAWRLGPLADGFRNVMTYVINTSRIFNAVACAGAARRACVVAHGYASHRRAFGDTIVAYPMVQETLADMRADTAAMVSGTFRLVHALDEAELSRLSSRGLAFLRLGLNLNKTHAAQVAHSVILSGIEVLGGNGTIEDFSVLPRLLRDNVVFENWEGSHNVLLLQVLRDCQRKGLHEGFFETLRAEVQGHTVLERLVDATRGEFVALLGGEPALATLSIRRVGARMSYLQWAAAMYRDGTPAEVRDHFVARRITGSVALDADYLERIRRISAEA